MEQRKRTERTGALLVAVSAVLYGCMPLLAKTAYAMGADTYTVCFGRFLFGSAAAAAAIALTPKLSFRVSAGEFLRLLAVSVFGSATTVLLYSSYRLIDSGMATTLHFTSPIWVMILGAVLFGAGIRPQQAACLLVCFTGVVFLSHPGQGGDLRGMGLALLSGATFALYVLLLGKTGLNRLPLLVVSFWVFLLSAAEIGTVSAVLGQLQLDLPWKAWAVIALLGIFVACMAQMLFQKGVFLCGEMKASLLGTLEPPVGVLVGALAFAEPVSVQTVTGVALILMASVLLVMLPERRLQVAKSV